MTVYVDDYGARFGRMIMCHMIADTESELHAMARSIGIARRHFHGDHYDICREKRAVAIMLGARAVTPRDIVRVRQRLRGRQ